MLLGPLKANIMPEKAYFNMLFLSQLNFGLSPPPSSVKPPCPSCRRSTGIQEVPRRAVRAQGGDDGAARRGTPSLLSTTTRASLGPRLQTHTCSEDAALSLWSLRADSSDSKFTHCRSSSSSSSFSSCIYVIDVVCARAPLCKRYYAALNTVALWLFYRACHLCRRRRRRANFFFRPMH